MIHLTPSNSRAFSLVRENVSLLEIWALRCARTSSSYLYAELLELVDLQLQSINIKAVLEYQKSNRYYYPFQGFNNTLIYSISS
jgi:hypothetical protein